MKITLTEFYSQLEKNQYPIIDKDEKMVYVVISEDVADADADKTSRLFHIVQDDPVLLEEEIFDFDEMASRLTPGFDPAYLVKVALKEAPPKQLLEIKQRLEYPEASVKTKPRCVSLMIGGKRGAPIELVLRR